MAFDLTKFLSEDLKLGADELAAVQTALNTPDRIAAIEKSLQRQQDYSRNMDKLKADQAALTLADKRVTAELAEIAKITAEGGTLTKKQHDDLIAAQTKAFNLEARITAHALANGIDPKDLLGDGAPAVRPQEAPVAPPIDLSKYTPTDQFGQTTAYMFQLMTELPMIAAEHQALTGQPLDTRAFRAEIERRAQAKENVDPRIVWEALHEIPAKREAKRTAETTAAIAAAEQRGREAALSEHGLPIGHHSATSTHHGRSSPVLHRTDDKGQPVQPIAARQQPQTTTHTAAGALRSGRYSGWQPGQPAPAAKTA